MEKAMLTFDKVNAHYGKIQALHDVSLHINQGEIVTLIGANGAGKTTLLGTLCGDPRATSGRIVFDGKDITDWQTARIMREAVAIVPEGRRVFSRMTVEENLAMGGFFAHRDEYQTRIKWVYELFPRLWERRIQRAGTMSGGEQQMLAIGRALMSQPRLLLLDEPSLGLAPIIIQQIFDTIEQLRKEGMTIFLVEQNANQALKLADRGYVLENGRVVLEDTGDALLANEAGGRDTVGVSVSQKSQRMLLFFVFSPPPCGFGWGCGHQTAPKPPPSPLHTTIIPLTPGCHLSVNKQLFFCNSSMSCYLASIKRVISRIRHNKRDDNDIVTTHSFGSGTGSGFCDERNGCDHHSVLAFHGRGVG